MFSWFRKYAFPPNPLFEGLAHIEMSFLKVEIFISFQAELSRPIFSILQSLPILPFLAQEIFAENNRHQLLLLGGRNTKTW